MKIRRRTRRPSKQDLARRARLAEQRAADYIAGLRAAAAWFEMNQHLIPYATTIDLDFRRSRQVEAFANTHGLAIEEWTGAIVATVHFGPVKIQAFGSTPDATDELIAAAQDEGQPS